MSLRIIKAGALDTVQDMGRYGYQHLGINPGGAMDRFAMQVINALLCNDRNEAVIEMHFPAAAILFEKDTMIAMGGAEFLPTVNKKPIPLWSPVIISGNTVLEFMELKKGARCYLAIKEGLQIEKWLNTTSTNMKAEAGGVNGRSLRKNDRIEFKNENDYKELLKGNDIVIMPWKAGIEWHVFLDDSIYVLPGNEWEWPEEESKKNFLNDSFTITAASDRMGYRLSGRRLLTTKNEELVSSAVGFGTIQMLPDGQLIILMADHQTTGGYPRIAHVISAHHSKLAQMRADEKIRFKLTDIKTAEKLLLKQQQHLQQLENACKFRLEEFLKR